MNSNNQAMEAVRKALARLFKALFGEKTSPSEYVNSSSQVEDFLGEMRDSCIKDGKVLEAYMFESQRLSLDSFKDQVLQGEAGNTNLDISAKDVVNNINGRLEDLKVEDEIKDAFQDYHNHDQEKLFGAKEVCKTAVSTYCTANGIPCGDQIGEIAAIGLEKVEEHMSEIPTSPAEAMGLVSEVTGLGDKGIANERNNDRDKDMDSTPTMDMTPY